MYQEIKKLADDALALQNKDVMDATLRQISDMCAPVEAEATVETEAKPAAKKAAKK